MVDCNKRQREKHKGTIRHRCIHPEAPTKNEIVPLHVCEACPLANLVQIKPCAEKQKEVQKAAAKSSVQVPQQGGPLPVLEPGFSECPYRYKGTAGHTCSITNLGVTPEICNRCDAETKEHQATFGEKVINYFGAVRRWVAMGRPTRTPEEIEQLFNEHCKGCDMYDKEKHACKSCGCNIAPVGTPLDNKLAMASEHCPLGRF